MKKRDFVAILGSLSDFIANERVEAYNEAVNMMLENVRAWMRDGGFEPNGRDLPDLLEEIRDCITKEVGAFTKDADTH